MTLSLIDSHCHLDDDRFDEDRDQIVERARACGIQQIIIPATTAERWGKVKRVSENYQGVFASYGLHPMFMGDHGINDSESLDHWLNKHQAVAVGECGLDFFVSNSDEEQQLELFRSQLTIATNHHLPVIIHTRKSLDLITREIRRSSVRSGVIHSFSGSLQQAQLLAELGFKLGIAATVSFERAKKLRQVVSEIDLDFLLIETDAPDQPGAGHRGERNEPAYMMDHLKVMAQLRQMDVEVLAGALTDNIRQLFNLPAVSP